MEKYLAIAFDDGPYAPMCEMVDKIAAYGWRAAFAVVGRELNEQTIPMLRYALDHGFQLVTHGQRHCDLKNAQNREEILEEMLTPVETVKQHLGYTMTMGRFAGLSGNALAFQVMQEIGMPLLGQGIVCGRDWEETTPPESIAQTVLSTVSDGAIGTLHVRKNTCIALDTILPELKRRGYTLVTPEELFKIRGVTRIPLGANIRFVR